MTAREVPWPTLERAYLDFLIFTCLAVSRNLLSGTALSKLDALGPNTVTGHTSVIFTEEVQVRHVMILV
jgi:hypothetical protein